MWQNNFPRVDVWGLETLKEFLRHCQSVFSRCISKPATCFLNHQHVYHVFQQVVYLWIFWDQLKNGHLGKIYKRLWQCVFFVIHAGVCMCCWLLGWFQRQHGHGKYVSDSRWFKPNSFQQLRVQVLICVAFLQIVLIIISLPLGRYAPCGHWDCVAPYSPYFTAWICSDCWHLGSPGIGGKPCPLRTEILLLLLNFWRTWSNAPRREVQYSSKSWFMNISEHIWTYKHITCSHFFIEDISVDASEIRLNHHLGCN